LNLRKVNAQLAQASRALGAGLSLPYAVERMTGTFTLHLALADLPASDGAWFDSAIGPFWLSDAAGVLGLMSASPVVVAGQAEPWYWQFINQQLSPGVAKALAPVMPLQGQAPSGPLMACRVEARLGDEVVQGYLQASPDTLMAWRHAAAWQPLYEAVDDSFTLPSPLVLGLANLTLEQLASLRPGDVLLPQLGLFDPQGQGQVTLGGRHWAAHTTCHDSRLSLTLSHEEYPNDE
jgi:type III secretion protein Q